MTWWQHALVLTALPLGLILAGYWLAASLRTEAAPTRLAVAALAGLATLLWTVSAVNAFRPLAGVWAALCLWPLATSLLLPGARRAFAADLLAVARTRRAQVAAALVAAFFLFLLWPLLSRPELVYYDGTASHDGFFWIVAAGHLTRHPYLAPPFFDSTHPLLYNASAITGWKPLWGRMGGEGLLALSSSLLGVAPIKLYITATAALLLPWIAAVFLTARTFLAPRLGWIATLALVALQPVFVFFHGNANLPNLLGALLTTAAVVATERSCRDAPARPAWLALLALSFHGLLCAYPEMLPFALIPGGLLWLRALTRPVSRPAALPVALAWLAGLALNPASTARAWHGFFASFGMARADQNWANLFAPLSAWQYPPAMATLSPHAAKYLGPLVCALLTLALVWALVPVVRRATDRLGFALALAGAAALFAYTVATGFNYGWQKTIQFGGPLWVAWCPVALIHALAAAAHGPSRWRRLHQAALAGLIAFFALASVLNSLDGYKWAGRKVITRDWFAVRDYARTQLPGAPLLVEPATFRTAFFYGMWVAYFFPDNPLTYAARGHQNGGYLRDVIATETSAPTPPPAAIIVGRDWADTFDANSPRLATGDTVVLLRTANRVQALSGLRFEEGVPQQADARITLDLTPHSASELRLTLAPRDAAPSSRRWLLRRDADGAPPFTSELSGPPPWIVRVPLAARSRNRVTLTADLAPAAASPTTLPPFLVTDIRIVTTPAP